MPLYQVDAVTLADWLKRDEAVVVDVREPSEHASECIQGAVLLPLGSVSKQALPDTQGKKLVIHCRSGGRSGNACAKLLAEDPALEIYNLEGGIGAWQAAGLAVKCAGKKCLPLDRQVQLIVGLSVLTGSLLGYFVNPLFFVLSGFFGAGLTFAGITGFCGLALMLAKMPWNQQGAPACVPVKSCMVRY
jgi:rhodanese-related sulfurtransferase